MLALADAVRVQFERAQAAEKAVKAKLTKTQAELKARTKKLEGAKKEAEACSAKKIQEKDAAKAEAINCAEKQEAVVKAQVEFDASTEELKMHAGELAVASLARTRAEQALAEAQRPHITLASRLAGARKVRCMTALCWGGTEKHPYKYGVEPLLDLPIGLAWSFGKGALSSYINSNRLNVEFNAGLRMWVMHDKLSFSVYFAKPVARSGDTIRLRGSSYEHSVERISRPFPGFALGVLGDSMLLGVGYDVLVNGSGTNGDPNYPPNQVVSRSLTFTLGFSTFTIARNAYGISAADNGETEQEEP